MVDLTPTNAIKYPPTPTSNVLHLHNRTEEVAAVGTVLAVVVPGAGSLLGQICPSSLQTSFTEPLSLVDVIVDIENVLFRPKTIQKGEVAGTHEAAGQDNSVPWDTNPAYSDKYDRKNRLTEIFGLDPHVANDLLYVGTDAPKKVQSPYERLDQLSRESIEQKENISIDQIDHRYSEEDILGVKQLEEMSDANHVRTRRSAEADGAKQKFTVNSAVNSADLDKIDYQFYPKFYFPDWNRENITGYLDSESEYLNPGTKEYLDRAHKSVWEKMKFTTGNVVNGVIDIFNHVLRRQRFDMQSRAQLIMALKPLQDIEKFCLLPDVDSRRQLSPQHDHRAIKPDYFNVKIGDIKPEILDNPVLFRAFLTVRKSISVIVTEMSNSPNKELSKHNMGQVAKYSAKIKNAQDSLQYIRNKLETLKGEHNPYFNAKPSTMGEHYRLEYDSPTGVHSQQIKDLEEKDVQQTLEIETLESELGKAIRDASPHYSKKFYRTNAKASKARKEVITEAQNNMKYRLDVDSGAVYEHTSPEMTNLLEIYCARTIMKEYMYNQLSFWLMRIKYRFTPSLPYPETRLTRPSLAHEPNAIGDLVALNEDTYIEEDTTHDGTYIDGTHIEDTTHEGTTNEGTIIEDTNIEDTNNEDTNSDNTNTIILTINRDTSGKDIYEQLVEGVKYLDSKSPFATGEEPLLVVCSVISEVSTLTSQLEKKLYSPNFPVLDAMLDAKEEIAKLYVKFRSLDKVEQYLRASDLSQKDEKLAEISSARLRIDNVFKINQNPKLEQEIKALKRRIDKISQEPGTENRKELERKNDKLAQIIETAQTEWAWISELQKKIETANKPMEPREKSLMQTMRWIPIQLWQNEEGQYKLDVKALNEELQSIRQKLAPKLMLKFLVELYDTTNDAIYNGLQWKSRDGDEKDVKEIGSSDSNRPVLGQDSETTWLTWGANMVRQIFQPAESAPITSQVLGDSQNALESNRGHNVATIANPEHTVATIANPEHTIVTKPGQIQKTGSHGKKGRRHKRGTEGSASSALEKPNSAYRDYVPTTSPSSSATGASSTNQNNPRYNPVNVPTSRFQRFYRGKQRRGPRSTLFQNHKTKNRTIVDTNFSSPPHVSQKGKELNMEALINSTLFQKIFQTAGPGVQENLVTSGGGLPGGDTYLQIS